MAVKLAIEGGSPVRSEGWPAWPVHGETEERALLEALRSGAWGIGGSCVPRFEQRFAGLHSARHGIACCNGTIALEIALVAAGVRPGDEVITSPYTFMATALAILTVGAVPVFVDVEEGTHNIDPGRIEGAITEKTTALMPVHIGGRPCDMDRLLEIARRRGLFVVEDAAQGWLASWRDRPVGALGDAGTFSFQSSKNLSAGEGGTVLTNDEDLYRRAWSYHNCGRTPGGEWYEHSQAGLNYRMTELQAALLLAGLDRLAEQQDRRRAAMRALDEGLRAVDGLSLPDADERITGHACHIYMVRLDRGTTAAERMAVVRALQAEGIPAHPGYTMPLYKQSFFNWFAERPTGSGSLWGDVWGRRYSEMHLPLCQTLCDTTIWIKQDVLLAGPEQMRDVVEAFDKVLTSARTGRLPVPS